MRYMLDTNICIYAIKNKPANVLYNLNKYDPKDICISSITFGELLYGVNKSSFIEKNRIALMLFLANIEVVSFDGSASERYGEVRSCLERKGTPIGQLDTLIASHCKSLGYTLVSNNIKEFKRIEGLKVANWA